MTMKIFEKQEDAIYFTFKNIRYLSSLLFGAITLGIIMNIFMGLRAFGFGITVYRDLLYLLVVAIMALLYYFKDIKLTTALTVIAYFIITCYTFILPFLFELRSFNFYAYFLEIQFLVMLFGLILTIGVKPYHDLILGAYNLVFATICVFVVQEFQIETYLFYVSIVSAKCIICFVVFEQVFKLRRKMKTHHETIRRQNAELLELTNFRKDIIRIIAHDLRNPIHQIASLLDVIDYSDTQKERGQIMGYLNKAVSNAYTLLENLLKWAMQNNEVLKEFTMMNVNELILSVENQLAEQISLKKLNVNKMIGSSEEIFYSKNVIESVTRNLLVNAVKFSPAKSDINVSFENKDTNFSLKFFNKTEKTQIENIKQFNVGKRPLKSTNGTSKELGSGNGLFVCGQMLEKNNGALSLKIEDGGVLATVFVTKAL